VTKRIIKKQRLYVKAVAKQNCGVYSSRIGSSSSCPWSL